MRFYRSAGVFICITSWQSHTDQQLPLSKIQWTPSQHRSLSDAHVLRHRPPCPACLLELSSHQNEPKTLQQQPQLCQLLAHAAATVMNISGSDWAMSYCELLWSKGLSLPWSAVMAVCLLPGNQPAQSTAGNWYAATLWGGRQVDQTARIEEWRDW